MNMHLDKPVSDEDLEEAGLVYVTETEAGIYRQRCGRGFSFETAQGRLIQSDDERARLLDIAVPPSYTDVWYCADSNGHLQATGYDSKGKKQYFYHAAWEKLRERHKFTLMTVFAQKLPSFRRHIRYRIHHAVSEKQTIIGCMIRLLDKTGMRIGNVQSAKTNHTYGLTTLHRKHICINGHKLSFQFDGKAGAKILFETNDAVVAQHLQQRIAQPSKYLFQCKNENGITALISAQDINDYIQSNMGAAFSAKDFRTWRFSCLFLKEMLRQQALGEVTLTSVLEKIVLKTCNTTAVLKESYIHPGLLMICKQREFERLRLPKKGAAGLSKYETCLRHYVKTRHAKQALTQE